jgi:hypothetical protein
VTLVLDPTGLAANARLLNGFVLRSNSVVEPAISLNTSVVVRAAPDRAASRIHRNASVNNEGASLNLTGELSVGPFRRSHGGGHRPSQGTVLAHGFKVRRLEVAHDARLRP